MIISMAEIFYEEDHQCRYCRNVSSFLLMILNIIIYLDILKLQQRSGKHLYENILHQSLKKNYK